MKILAAERQVLQGKVEKHESEWRRKLCDEQSLELAQIMKVIDANLSDDLERVFTEAKERSKSDTQLHKEWEKDREYHITFYRDQAKNGMIFRIHYNFSTV